MRAFQDDRGLAAARALQSLGRGGDTILAHITVEEARLLKTLGGAGTVNPATGLMEFWGRLGGSTFERERAAKAALREASTTRALEKRQRSGDWDATMAMHFGLGGDGGIFTQVSDERPQDLDTFGIETLGEGAFTKTPDKAEQARIAGRILGLTDEPRSGATKTTTAFSGPSLSSMTAATGPEAQPKPSSKPKPKTTRTVSPAHQALMDRVNAKIVANRARVKNYLDEADAMKASGHKMTADNRKAAWTKATQNLLDYEAEAWGTQRVLSQMLSLPPIPDNKVDWYNDHPGLDKTRTQFFQALVKAGLPQTTINSLMGILDREGGLTLHSDGTTYGGIRKTTLKNLNAQGFVRGIAPNTLPQNLTPAQSAEAYKGYFDDAFKAKNGVDALKQISDPDAQEVLADSLFSHGLKPGTRTIQQGINAVTGGSLGTPDGIPGSRTFAALNALMNNPQTRNSTLNAIADARYEYVKEKYPPQGHKGWKERIDSLRPSSSTP